MNASARGARLLSAAIVDGIKPQLGTRCLPRWFSVDDEGHIACSIVELVLGARDCESSEGRSEVDELVAAAVIEHCKRSTGLACDEVSLCHIDQLSGDDLQECQQSVDYAGGVSGFCYVDAAQAVGNEALVRECPATEQRKLQFVGENTPAVGSLTFVVCEGSSDE